MDAAAFGHDGKAAVTFDGSGGAVRWDLSHPGNRMPAESCSTASWVRVRMSPSHLTDGRSENVDSSDTVATWRMDSEPGPWQRAEAAADPVAVAAVADLPGRADRGDRRGTRALVLWDITDPDRPAPTLRSARLLRDS